MPGVRNKQGYDFERWAIYHPSITVCISIHKCLPEFVYPGSLIRKRRLAITNRSHVSILVAKRIGQGRGHGRPQQFSSHLVWSPANFGCYVPYHVGVGRPKNIAPPIWIGSVPEHVHHISFLKMTRYLIAHNICKCWPIFKIFSPSDSAVIL